MGYNGFSYYNLAEDLSIKTASIHYHFRKKEDLAVAVLQQVQGQIMALQEQLDGQPELDAMQKFDTYLQVFVSVFEDKLKICPCGALAVEFMSLPESLQQEVSRFFELNTNWLTVLFDTGRTQGHFKFEGDADSLSQTVFSALEGALLVTRSTGNPKVFMSTLGSVKKFLV